MTDNFHHISQKSINIRCKTRVLVVSKGGSETERCIPLVGNDGRFSVGSTGSTGVDEAQYHVRWLLELRLASIS